VGGLVIGTGTPEQIAELKTATGKFLRAVLHKPEAVTAR
jgi:excinuclease UvrABC ATPase subunit